MARAEDRLSARHLNSKPTGMYGDGGGLYLQVTANERGAAVR
jgi:hypothetical protein